MLAPWADALYAMDTPWWDVYHGEVAKVFKGLRFRGAASTPSRHARQADFGQLCRNSGAGALAMAAQYGAELIIMLGYDCKAAEDGSRHWHGAHVKGLGNAGAMPKWAEQFHKVSKQLGKTRVVNATRDTALTCFEQMRLEDALNLALL